MPDLSKRKSSKTRTSHPGGHGGSALEHVRLFESLGFDRIKISLKSSNVLSTIDAYELLSRQVDYPLHLGVTEAGTLISGTVKNALGIGILLFKGIGDTLRVSLSRDPVEEVKVGYEILRALDLRHRGPEIISCPTCGRCEIDLFTLVEQWRRRSSGIHPPRKWPSWDAWSTAPVRPGKRMSALPADGTRGSFSERDRSSEKSRKRIWPKS